MSLPLLLHSRHDPQATYQPVGDWLVPWRYHSSEVEYDTLRHRVGLIDFSTQALIQVQGGDQTSFLHNLLTNDIRGLTSGRGCQAALLRPNAALVATMRVFAEPEALWLICDATRSATVMQTFGTYHFTEDVILTNHERQHAVLALQGPGTMACLAHLFNQAVSLPTPGDHIATTLDGIPLRLIRDDLAGESGVLCLCPAPSALELWDCLQERGRSSGLQLVGWEALNTARIEAGIPWWGLDMTEANLLPETGLQETLTSGAKGCYLGQEIVARMATYGSANKKLMGLWVEGDTVPEPGEAIVRDGGQVGWVTSACRSIARGRPIAMGYLKRGAYEPGTAVGLAHGDAWLPATVVARPVVPACAM